MTLRVLAVAALLTAQVTAPVRFTEMIRRMHALGVERVLEIGPGRVLTGLVARIERGLARASLGGVEDLEAAAHFARGEAGAYVGRPRAGASGV